VGKTRIITLGPSGCFPTLRNSELLDYPQLPALFELHLDWSYHNHPCLATLGAELDDPDMSVFITILQEFAAGSVSTESDHFE
jgi:hypothetical protein